MAGKHKGNSWERDIAEQLSRWWTGGERDDCFYRSQNSGGRATARGKVGKKADLHCGDIAAADSVGEPLTKAFIIEAKKGYNQTVIHELLDRGKQSELVEWFLKAEVDRTRAGALYWMLIHRRDYREPLIFVPSALVWKLEILGDFETSLDRITLNVKDHEVTVFRLDDFLLAVTPQIVYKLIDKLAAEREEKYCEEPPSIQDLAG